MNIFPRITSRFTNRIVQVSIDTRLVCRPGDADDECGDIEYTVPQSVSFNLFRLIHSIGTIQTRRENPSNRNKFFDKSDLLGFITPDTDEFMYRISDIQSSLGPDKLRTFSEDLGVGLSVVAVSNLYEIDYTTVACIPDTGKRPDWSCQTKNGLKIVVEAKGTTSNSTSKDQEESALKQKEEGIADIRLASLSVIRENQSSDIRLIDPPSKPDDLAPENRKRILKASHYASVFSFLGQPFLSKYYSKMKKRLVQGLDPQELGEKNRMYHKLLYILPQVQFNNLSFTGHFYKIDNGNYIYTGIDKRLLTYYGFNDFEDIQDNIEETIGSNHYILFKDGILIIEISDIAAFSNVIPDDYRIKHYQESNTISDVDEMSGISFEKYILYVLNKLDFSIELLDSHHDIGFDIIGEKNGVEYLFELKLFKNKMIKLDDIVNQIESYSMRYSEKRCVLITNAKFDREYTFDIPNIVIIDREKLRKVMRNNSKLLHFIENA